MKIATLLFIEQIVNYTLLCVKSHGRLFCSIIRILSKVTVLVVINDRFKFHSRYSIVELNGANICKIKQTDDPRFWK